MQELKQLNIKLPSDLYDLILKTGKSRKDVIIDALMLYFDVNEHNQQQEPQQNDNASHALMVEQLQTKDTQISSLHNQIEQLYILLQTELSKNIYNCLKKRADAVKHLLFFTCCHPPGTPPDILRDPFGVVVTSARFV